MKRIITLMILGILFVSCSNSKVEEKLTKELNQMEQEKDSLQNIISNGKSNNQVTSFLTFQNDDAEEAINLYVELFDNSKIIDLKRWEQGSPGKEGKIMHATFSLNGKLFMCSDSPIKHDWNFTPGVSNFVECKDEKELEYLFTKLSENGTIMMPLGNYGFSKKFGFVADKFGVSWQLNLK